MTTLKIETARELKKVERESIVNINGISFNKMYPMLEVTNNHVSYYSVDEQRNITLNAPYMITL